MSLLKYGYYDHPEGTDAFGKIVGTNKYAIGAGLVFSTYDVLMYTKTKGYLPTLGRFAYNTVPMMGMATAFTLATYMSTNLRGKDDKLNYFIGGMAAGSVMGSWKRSPFLGFQMGIIFGIAATVKKLSKEQGWEFFPKMKTHQYGSVSGHDFTWMAERPKTWTKGE